MGLDNSIMQISHRSLKTNSLIKIINPITNKTLTLKNHKRLKYPEMYKVLITKPVADKLDLNSNLPLVEIMEQKKINLLLPKKLKFLMKKKKYPSKCSSDLCSNIQYLKKQNEKNQPLIRYFHFDSFIFQKKQVF